MHYSSKQSRQKLYYCFSHPSNKWALELKGCLVYGWAVSKKLPTSFLICCSKAFYDGALLDNASVGSWVIRFVWWRSFPHNAWYVEWNFRRPSACPCHSPSSANAWSAAKGPYRLWSSSFHRQSRGPCQRWSPPLARANIGIFFSDERAEFVDFDEGAGFGLWWACWECLGSLHQPARDRLMMDPENPTDGSHPDPF